MLASEIIKIPAVFRSSVEENPATGMGSVKVGINSRVRPDPPDAMLPEPDGVGASANPIYPP